MVFILQHGASNQEIANLEKKLFTRNRPQGFNAKKYNGLIRLTEDPLNIQKQLRDEWERVIG